MMVSIIIATYNSSSFIKECLKSIVEQSSSNWECLVIDGNSKDETISIVKHFQSKNTRIRYVSEPDNGIYDAFNKGWKMAKGEWVYYLGSDDRLCPGALEFFDNISSRDSYDIVYGNIIEDLGNSKTRRVRSKDYNMLWYRFFGSHQTVFMRKSVIEKLGGFNLDYKIKADFDLVQKAFLAGKRFVHLDWDVAFFSLGGVSNSKVPLFDKERFRILKTNKSTHFPFAVVLWLGLFLNLRSVLYKFKYFFN